ncbi:Ig-like domain-containing protein [Shewanella mangrovisoli]|uniref:Ig-like domain-containing protein n=1 Tax=Shewanella mangrovisoli TaxID=2864211 RepID=UPI0035BAC45F
MRKLIPNIIAFIFGVVHVFTADAIPQSIQIHKPSEIVSGEFSTSFMSPSVNNFIITIPVIDGLNINESDIELITPSGVIIKTNNASLNNCKFLYFTTTPEEHLVSATRSYIIELSNVSPGRYAIKGKANGSSGKIPLNIKFPTSKINFTLIIGEVGPNKKPITVGKIFPLYVQLTDGGIPLTTAEVSFEFLKDDIVVNKVIALDNGSEMDFKARDGSYHAFFTPDVEGQYTVLVRIHGANLSGELFEMSVNQNFNSILPQVYVTGKVEEVLIDLDKDGYIDELRLEFETAGQFQSTGFYYNRVKLETEDGTKIFAGNKIDATDNKIFVTFKGEELRSLGYSGKFTVSDFWLDYGYLRIQDKDNFYTTSYFEHDSWERDDLLYLGNVTFEPIDSEDGHFIEIIDASFEVDTLPATAKFGYSATITTVGDEHVGVYGNPDIELKKGVNRITFSIPEADFAKLQSNTALKIKQLTMYPLIKGGNVISKRNVATSLVYSCWDFRGCSAADNAIPVAVDDAVTSLGKAMYIHVAQNDLDDDGDLLKVNSVTPAQHGIAEIVGNSIQYTPSSGFEGDDVFQYEIVDTHPRNNILKGGSAIGTVRVSVKSNHAPNANTGSYHY